MARSIFYDSLKKILFAFFAMLFVAPAFSATLPTGYTQLEYIANAGSVYVDLGMQFGDGNFEIDITTLAQSGSFYLFQSRLGSGVIRGVSGSTSGNTINGNAGNANSEAVTSSIVRVPGQKYDIHYKAENGTQILTVYDYTNNVTDTKTKTYTTGFSLPANACLFGNTSGDRINSGTRIYKAKLWKEGVLVLDLIPAKNSNNVVGFYDTVSNTFKTATAGTFTAGPAKCRNLLDISSATLGYLLNVSGQPNNNVNYYTTDYVNLDFSGDFIVSFTKTAQQNGTTGNIICFYDSNKTFLNCSGQTSAYNDPSVSYWTYTGAVPNNAAYYRYSYRKTDIEMQLELGSIATAYVPHCTTDGIKIATTKYNEDAFANLVTTLNSAITKVTNIVDTTVAQASSIGTLATTKQDRPADGDCPAGRKCLLVTGTDGKPHWYLIQE